jgi:hypothetical protein
MKNLTFIELLSIVLTVTFGMMSAAMIYSLYAAGGIVTAIMAMMSFAITMGLVKTTYDNMKRR